MTRGNLSWGEIHDYMNLIAEVVVPDLALEESHGTVYVFFGYEKDANRWAKKHGIARSSVVTANKWITPEPGLRPTPVFDEDWYTLNFNHVNSIRAKDQICIMSRLYGMGDPVV